MNPYKCWKIIYKLAIRPETSTVVARRLIAANVDSKIAKQIRAAVEEEAIIKVNFPTNSMISRHSRIR